MPVFTSCCLLTFIIGRSVRYNLDLVEKPSVHAKDGRVIVIEFDDFELVATYGANNGWTQDSFARRREWDDLLLRYFTRKKEQGAPVIWCGDLNVAHEDKDVSHPAWFATRVGEGVPRPADEEDVGQPGFTPAERARFTWILKAGEMIDAYRMLHPEASDRDYTWRGTAPTNMATARYYGKGMRIDYVIVSSQLKDRVEAVEICGYGRDREGFMGSDHCPVLLRLRPPVPSPSVPPAPAAAPETAENSSTSQIQAREEPVVINTAKEETKSENPTS
jgi:exodeoxyribonuclease III